MHVRRRPRTACAVLATLCLGTTLALAPSASAYTSDTVQPAAGTLARIDADAAANGGTTVSLLSNTRRLTITAPHAGTRFLSLRMRGEMCDGGPIAHVVVNGNVTPDIAVDSTTYVKYNVALPASVTSISSVTIAMINDRFMPPRCDRNLFVDEATFTSSDLANIMARPFNASSPWNIPLPTTTTFGAAPNFAGAIPYTNNANYSNPVYATDPSNALATIHAPASWGFSAQTLQLRLPAGAKGSDGTDGSMNVIDEPSGQVYAFWQVKQAADGSYTVKAWAVTPLNGTGWGSNGKAAGISAVGSSYLGGIVTGENISRGVIDHGLSIALTGAALQKGWVAPAISGDGYMATGIKEGTRLAIPSSTPKPTNLSPLGSMMWDALVKYGAYVTDQTVGSTGFGVDPNTVPVALTGALNSQPTWTNSDMVKLTKALRTIQ